MKELFLALQEALSNGKNVVLCSIIASSGSTPRGAGAKMIIFEDGTTLGTIGGGAVEHAASLIGLEVHQTRKPFTKAFTLAPNQVADLGMICGGDVKVYFQFFASDKPEYLKLVRRINELLDKNVDSWLITEIHEESIWNINLFDRQSNAFFSQAEYPQDFQKNFKSQAVLIQTEPAYYVEPLSQSGYVYVFGGGHVSKELVPMIARVGFRPVVFEDREQFSDLSLFPGAVKVVQGNFHSISEKITITDSDYVVIMTRGHQADYQVLEQALRTPASYVGVIGSRHKMAATQSRLREAGICETDIARIHNPIGLPILAETPEEIAISITAELILHRAQHRNRDLLFSHEEMFKVS